MVLVTWIYWTTGGLGAALALALLSTSLREHQPRASLVSGSLLFLFLLVWCVVGVVAWRTSAAEVWRVILLVLFWGSAALFFLPFGRRRPILVIECDDQVDERDVLFSREEYVAGTPEFRAYYTQHPGLQAGDDRIRQLPELLTPGGLYYESTLAKSILQDFDRIERLGTEVDGPRAKTCRPVAAETGTVLSNPNMTDWVKHRVRALGAHAVGIARLEKRYLYSHVGRGPEPWGTPIVNHHPFAIMFSLEMEADAVDTAPQLPITAESSRNYLRGAQISIRLAREIRAMGYEARAHIAGSNYQIMLPPLAHAAGLGELGRMGYLIAPQLGPRLRLGAVTTTLGLDIDHPIEFGVPAFCKHCKKCVANCPSGSIPDGAQTWERGVLKWQLRLESCLHYWRVAGSDCGLCMRVCPYSHPPTLIHNLIRFAIRHSTIARRVSVWGDDLLYGRRIRIPR